jgi:hypothetical protein
MQDMIMIKEAVGWIKRRTQGLEAGKIFYLED